MKIFISTFDNLSLCYISASSILTFLKFHIHHPGSSLFNAVGGRKATKVSVRIAVRLAIDNGKGIGFTVGCAVDEIVVASNSQATMLTAQARNMPLLLELILNALTFDTTTALGTQAAIHLMIVEVAIWPIVEGITRNRLFKFHLTA
jgi:hypothetical protein